MDISERLDASTIRYFYSEGAVNLLFRNRKITEIFPRHKILRSYTNSNSNIRYSRWELLGRRTVGQTRQRPILKVILVETSLFGRRMGSLVNSHTLLTKAVSSVTKDNTPHRMPNHDSVVLLRA